MWHIVHVLSLSAGQYFCNLANVQFLDAFCARKVWLTVGRMLKLAYLAPPVLEKLLIARVSPVVSVKELAEVTDLPWAEQAGVVFADQ